MLNTNNGYGAVYDFLKVYTLPFCVVNKLEKINQYSLIIASHQTNIEGKLGQALACP